MAEPRLSQTENGSSSTRPLDLLAEEQGAREMGLKAFPYPTRLSFVPLIEFFSGVVSSADEGLALLARKVLKRVQKVPAFLEPIDEPALLEEHRDLVDLLMTPLIPKALNDTQLMMVSKPFDLQAFYQTPSLARLKAMKGISLSLNQDQEIMKSLKVTRSCSLILNRFYGQKIDLDLPFIFTLQKAGESVQYHYKSLMNIDFMEIRQTRPLKPLSQETINGLLSNLYDVNRWLEALPPDHFEFHGLVRSQLIDVTEEETLSRLKFKLLEKEGIVTRENILVLEQHLRNLFRKPGLKLGITAIDYPPESAVPHRYRIRYDLLAERYPNLLTEDTRGSIHEKVCRYKDTLLIEDLTKMSDPTPVEVDLVNMGIRSIIVAPLLGERGKVIGLLELGSPHSNDFHSFSLIKLREIVPLFCIALERFREEIETQLQAIIQEQFTTIHPSVGWKFTETAYNLLEKKEREGINAKPDPIVLQDVYPLYGQADIVGSSKIRNEAIQADFIDNLERIRRVLEVAGKQLDLPLLRQYIFEVEQCISGLELGINSSDETRIIDFIKNDLHSFLDHISSADTAVSVAINRYYGSLDPEFGIIYRKRKAFEESVSIINDTISQIIERENSRAQEILPHYFEKYRTDGVEYDMYVGQSLLRSGNFSYLDLKNFRLWQLVTMCEVTRKVAGIRDELYVPLTTAQLIFAYNTPLAIRFRMDEKQFDVDGAYNVRYEILKKRIDKAYIDGTNERLTLPGKIAIVYTSEKDRQEYYGYLQFLISEGLIGEEIEDLRLAPVQGVQGLNALRVTVNVEV